MSNKKRAIDSSIRKSQTFARLTFQQRDLWHGLIAVADDQGRLPGLPAYVRSQVWPYQDIELQVVASDLTTLESIGNILIYQSSGQTFIQIVNWWKYQAMQWAGPSDYPAPEGWIDRMRFHTADNKVKAVNWDTPGGFLISVSTPVPTGVPTYVPTQLGSRDVNGEVKGNGDGEGEGDGKATPPAPAASSFSNFETGQARASFHDNHARMSEKLYQLITGQISIPPDQRAVALETLGNILDHFHGDVEKAAASGKPVFAAWCNTKGRNGSNYSKINTNWITKWLERLGPQPEPDTVNSLAESVRRDMQRITGRSS